MLAFYTNQILISFYYLLTSHPEKNNPNIIFRADKGNITVTLEKTEYLNKIEEMFNDTETYEKINKDPTKKLQMKYERY